MTTQEMNRLHMTLVLFAYAFALQGITVLTALWLTMSICLGVYQMKGKIHYEEIGAVYAILVLLTKMTGIGAVLPEFYFIHFGNALFVSVCTSSKMRLYRIEYGVSLALFGFCEAVSVMTKGEELACLALMIFMPLVTVGTLKQVLAVQKHRRNAKVVIKSNA